QRQVLLQVLGSLKQRVVWKWDQDTIPDLPSNIRLGKWFKQQDILGDHRLRLFITHGGLLSTQEATYNGVPVLGIPFFSDQYNNMQAVQSHGWGVYQPWDQLTTQTFNDSIHKVLYDQRMRSKAQQLSVIMSDQPHTPAHKVTYWVRYVIRHSGARHLRSPLLDMPWYQVYNVDVWATVVVVILVTTTLLIGLLAKTVSLIWHHCRKKNACLVEARNNYNNFCRCGKPPPPKKKLL
ncbi:hypothetical protein Pcinc_038698, partial [Petrolisthes cinctipes]